MYIGKGGDLRKEIACITRGNADLVDFSGSEGVLEINAYQGAEVRDTNTLSAKFQQFLVPSAIGKIQNTFRLSVAMILTLYLLLAYDIQKTRFELTSFPSARRDMPVSNF